MAKVNLLQAKGVKSAKPKAKKYRLNDGGGLSLMVTPAGSKSWRWKYFTSGKQREITLGAYPAISLQAARVLRDEARTKLAKGIDPAEEKQAINRAKAGVDSFESVGREWLAKKKTEWAESNYTRIKSRLERDVFPAIGCKQVTDISPSDVIKVIKAVESRGAVESAYRNQQYIRQIFTHAIITERCISNPAQDLQEVLTKPVKTHRAAVTDPNELGKVLSAFDNYSGTLPVKAALRLTPLLFMRSGELRNLTWNNVDMEAREIRFTASKTKIEMIVPLANQALDILKKLHPYTIKHGWVFTGSRPSKPISENATLTAMRNLGIPKEQACNHGFRATARTLLEEKLRFPVTHIEMQLGHAVRDVHGRAYNRTQFIEERRDMMQRWADYLDSLKTASQSSNVIVINSSKTG